jgi:general secretion pathway protein H
MQRGFTLLELVVVMALVALAIGLVAPAAQRGMEAARERGIASDVSAALAGMPVRAFQRGAPQSIDEPVLRELVPSLPRDWRVDMPKALRYAATGVASGGLLSLQPPAGKALVWRIHALNGEVERIEPSRGG